MQKFTREEIEDIEAITAWLVANVPTVSPETAKAFAALVVDLPSFDPTKPVADNSILGFKFTLPPVAALRRPKFFKTRYYPVSIEARTIYLDPQGRERDCGLGSRYYHGLPTIGVLGRRILENWGPYKDFQILPARAEPTAQYLRWEENGFQAIDLSGDYWWMDDQNFYPHPTLHYVAAQMEIYRRMAPEIRRTLANGDR